MDDLSARTTRSRPFLVTISLLGCLLAAFGCGVDDQIHQAALRDLQQQKQLARDRGSHIKARDEQIELLNRRVELLETERKGADTALANARKSMEEMARSRAQAEARATQFRKLVSQFRKMTETGKLKVEIRDNRMIVSMGDQILFDPGKTQLKKEGADTLQQVTKILKDIEKRDFQVAGHTDNTPMRSARFRSNWDLSTARAVEVVQFMIASGMEPHRVSAAGYSDQAPVASNDQPEGKAKNRRIEITLMPNLEDLPPIAGESKSATTTGDGGATSAPHLVAPAVAPAVQTNAVPASPAGTQVKR